MAIAPISALSPAGSLTSIQPLNPATKAATTDFGKIVSNLVQETSQLQDQAASEVAKLAAGKTDNVHQVMLAMGKSEVQFNYMMEVRNRLVDAYKEVMRMSV